MKPIVYDPALERLREIATNEDIGVDYIPTHTHNASAINAGTLDVARIPDLAASKITSGTLDVARIPSHNHAIGDVTNLQNALDAKQNTSSLATAVRSVMESAVTHTGVVVNESLGRIQVRSITAAFAFDPTGHTLSEGNVVSITFATDATPRSVTFPSTMNGIPVRGGSAVTIAASRWRTVSIMRTSTDIQIDWGADKAVTP